MGGRAFKDHFSSHAAGYAAHRPTYPDLLVDTLADLAPATDRALDAACGTGQLSVPLARRFSEVVATDASAAQIAAAAPHPRVAYRVALAEASALPNADVDLVTVAQAAHWLDLDALYAEVRRIARPGAVLALVTYGILHLDGEPEAVVQDFYGPVLGPHWPPERRHVEEGYRGLPFPFRELTAPPMEIAVAWDLAELLGYVATWSALRGLENARGRAPAERFRADLTAAWGPPETRRAVRWPLSLRLARL